MKLLVVGDPHAKQDELGDCENLMLGIVDVLQTNPFVDKIVFMGDLFHNHSIVHVSVLDFWNRWFLKLKEMGFDVIAIKGNHDFGVSDPEKHALLPFSNICTVVDKPLIIDNLTFLPYFGHKKTDEFYKTVEHSTEILFCHETFDGAKYENGFFAPDGFDQNRCAAKYIISGHIHSPMELVSAKNTVKYIGSPRWQTVSDANTERSIGIFDTETLNWQHFPTSKYCRQIFKTDISSLEELSKIKKQDNSQHTLILKGTKSEVDKMLDLIKDKGFLIKKVIDNQDIKIKESLGIDKAYSEFVKEKIKTLGYEEELAESIIREAKWMGN